MSEFNFDTPGRNTPEDAPQEPTVEQMLRDLEAYENVQYDDCWVGSAVDLPSFSFVELYGYPDPIEVARCQSLKAEQTAEPTSLRTPEQMATDLYYYRRNVERVYEAEGHGQAVRPFFEIYGYPDPREAGTEPPGTSEGAD